MRIAKGLEQRLGTGLEPLGTMVWLKLPGNIDVLINNLRIQVYHPDAFTDGNSTGGQEAGHCQILFHFSVRSRKSQKPSFFVRRQGA